MRYVLTPEQSAKFDAVFEMHSDGGFMSGARVRDCLIKSELPKEELSTVWGLCKSEANLSPNLGRLEFRVAMHLVTLRLQGVPLPHVLPACLQSHRDGSHGPEAVASPGARSKSVVWPCHGSESIDWGAVMAPSPRGLSNSLLVSGVPRLASVDWPAGLQLADPLSRSFPGVSRQLSQSSGRQSYRAANPFRRQESDSSRKDSDGDSKRKSCRDLLSGMGLDDRNRQPSEAESSVSTASTEQLQSQSQSQSQPQPQSQSLGATWPPEASDRESFWATTAAQKAAFAAAFGRAQDSSAAEAGAAVASGSSSSMAEAGFVSRTEALELFEKVWRLCDLDRDQRLSAPEFSRALVCVSRLLEGRPLPQVLAVQLRREGPLQVNGGARCHCVLERCELKLYTCDLLSETLASALQKPPQVTIPLGGAISFSRLDASQTSRPHVFLLTSTEPLRLSLDSFTRSTTEVDFQATDEASLQSWLDDLQYVCSDPVAAPPAAR